MGPQGEGNTGLYGAELDREGETLPTRRRALHHESAVATTMQRRLRRGRQIEANQDRTLPTANSSFALGEKGEIRRGGKVGGGGREACPLNQKGKKSEDIREGGHVFGQSFQDQSRNLNDRRTKTGGGGGARLNTKRFPRNQKRNSTKGKGPSYKKRPSAGLVEKRKGTDYREVGEPLSRRRAPKERGRKTTRGKLHDGKDGRKKNHSPFLGEGLTQPKVLV